MQETQWWTSGRVPAMGPLTLFRRLEWALSTFRERGVRVPATCRASKSLDLLRSLADQRPTERAAGPTLGFAEFAEHHRTAFELFLIALATAQCRATNSPFTLPKLQAVVLGPELIEGRDRSARNMQFELLTAARFSLAGVAVSDGEPDMIIILEGQPVGVAAKRVTSQSVGQTRKRVREAITQIEGTPFRGIVALNLEGRLPALSPSATASEVERAADDAFGIVDELARAFLPYERLLGIVAFDSMTRPSLQPSANQYPSLDTTTPVKYWMLGNPFEIAAAGTFFARWRDGWLATLSALGSWHVDDI